MCSVTAFPLNTSTSIALFYESISSYIYYFPPLNNAICFFKGAIVEVLGSYVLLFAFMSVGLWIEVMSVWVGWCEVCLELGSSFTACAIFLLFFSWLFPIRCPSFLRRWDTSLLVVLLLSFFPQTSRSVEHELYSHFLVSSWSSQILSFSPYF